MGMVLAGFTFTMLGFALIGLASSRAAQAQVSDYLVAGRATPPWIAGLSAVASNNSGFMFIGAVGLTYRCGLAAFWLFFAWIAGDYLSWLLVHRKLRERSEAQDNNSVTGFLAHDGTSHQRALQLLLGCLTVVFLTLYAAAQLKAGSKAIESTLQWSPTSGMIMGAVMVAAYSFAGGIRASMWTDVAQAMVMIIAMSALVWVCHQRVAPLSELTQHLGAIDPDLLKWSPAEATLGLWPYAMGWFIAGFGGIGQPHMIIRAMTVSSPQGVTQMRRIYFTWYILFSVLTMLVGLFARVYFERASHLKFDEEVALPLLADAHLAPLWVGLILAGVFAASMSTADSQVLASSASLTQDIMTHKRESYLASKVATLSVVACALVVALLGPSSVFELVTLAWGLMMTCLAPLMIARVMEWHVSFQHYLVVISLGLAAMLTWKYQLGLGNALYEGAVGFLVTMPLLALSAHLSRSQESSQSPK
jgi:Na+/proline symporter